MRGSRGPRQPGGGKQTAGPRHQRGERSSRPYGTGGKRPVKGGGPGRKSFDARPRRAAQDGGEREGAAPQHRKGSFRHPEARAKAHSEGRRSERPGRGSFEERPRRFEDRREHDYDRPSRDDGDREGTAPRHRKGGFRHADAAANRPPRGEGRGRSSFEPRTRRREDAPERGYARPPRDDGEQERRAPRRSEGRFGQPKRGAKRFSKGGGQSRSSFEPRPRRVKDAEGHDDRSPRSDGERDRKAPRHRGGFRHPEARAQRASKGDGLGRASFEARQRRAPQDDGEHSSEHSRAASSKAVGDHAATAEGATPSPPTTVQNVIVTADEAGMRVDRFLEARFPGLSFSHIQRVIRKGELRVNGKRTQPKNRLEAGQTVRIPPLRVDAPKPRDGGSEADEKTRAFLASITLYEDADVMVLNKPMGLAVQGGSGTTRHVDGMLEVLRDAHGQRPRLVHRLDKDTAGCLLVAKTRFAAAALAKTFRSRSARKIYWALVASVPKVQQGRISTYLVKDEREEESIMRIARHGEEGASHAVTYYAVVETSGPLLSWLSLKPVTGRTHQLRAHMAHINHPIIGDPKYFSRENWELPGGMQNRLHLLARRIAVPHPRGGVVDVTAPLPPHMLQSWNLLGFDATRYDPIVEAPEE
jgi:23S rRNA pseudouridine955/2504/2580 synthase